MSGQPRPTFEELRAAWATHHMNCFSDFILWALSMAARQEPERLRAALRDVFSSDAVEEMSRNALELSRSAAREVHATAAEVRELLRCVAEEIDALERRLDAAAGAFRKLRPEPKPNEVTRERPKEAARANGNGPAQRPAGPARPGGGA